ncbi:MAG: ATP-binding protein, partial [Mariniblastus sp.]
TKLIGEELLVDSEEGATISVDKLSRGTREAVYLSLRLALVRAYARRGSVVPMVLDDVLVNFDGRRIRAAAEVLCEFSSQGHQILMFTCHDHIRDVFHSLAADVRVLPDHRDVIESKAVPLPYKGVKEIEVQPELPEFKPKLMPEVDLLNPTALESDGIPVEYVEYASTNVRIDPEQYDSELEFELAVVASDQKRELNYLGNTTLEGDHSILPMEISENDEFWTKPATSLD